MRRVLGFLLLFVAPVVRAGDELEDDIQMLSRWSANDSRRNVVLARLRLDEAGRRLEAAGDPVAAWRAYWILAEHERRFGRRADLTLQFHEKALAVLERAKKPGAPFRVESLAALGKISGVLPLSSAAPDFTRSLFLQLFEAVSRDGYAGALLDVGDLEKAEAQLAIATKLATPFRALLDRSIARHLGRLRRRQWRLDEARESYRRALAAPSIRLPFTIDDRGERDVAALGDLADIEALAGRTDEALRWNDRALAITRAANETAAEATLLVYRATLLERGGRMADAEHVYAEALSAAEAKNDVPGRARILAGRAFMNLNRGRFGAALVDSEKALELLATVEEPWFESALLANLATTYLGLGAGDSGASALERARDQANKSGFWLGAALLDVIVASNSGKPEDLDKALERWSQLPEVRGIDGSVQLAALIRALTGKNPGAGIGAVDRRGLVLPSGLSEALEMMTLLEQNRFSAAREAAMRSLASNTDSELRPILFAVIAMTYGGEEQWEPMIDYMVKAADAFDLSMGDVGASDLLSGFVGNDRTVFFDALLDILVLTGRFEEAFEVSERARARAFLHLIGNRRIRPRTGESSRLAREADALRMQIAQWQQQARVAPSRQLHDDLRGARRRYEGLMTRVKASDPEYAAMTSVDAASLEAIRAELPPDATLISYFVSRTGVHAWVLDRATLRHTLLRVDEAWLDRATCTTLKFGRDGRGVQRLEASCRAVTVDDMYEQLFAPLRKHVRNRRLIIVPHRGLHYLPFAAFRDPRTRRHLIEDFTITYAPSASALRFLREKETSVNGRALVLGAPEGVSPALPGALREAVMVAAELRSTPMTGSAAKENLLYGLAGEVDLVHVAAHGYYEPDAPLFSRVALAAGDGNDGDLQVSEVLSDLDLTGVNLVVLAACQTAVGKVSRGDDVVGLTRAFLYAGTPGVVSTLWDIGDDAAAALMSDFYCRLLMGDTAADALRHAQLSLLHGDYPDPRQWAAFTLTGDPQGRWNVSGAVDTAK